MNEGDKGAYIRLKRAEDVIYALEEAVRQVLSNNKP